MAHDEDALMARFTMALEEVGAVLGDEAKTQIETKIRAAVKSAVEATAQPEKQPL
jgi:hypothetical protein